MADYGDAALRSMTESKLRDCVTAVTQQIEHIESSGRTWAAYDTLLNWREKYHRELLRRLLG